MTREISNSDDIIDSRDVIERIEELEDQQKGAELDCSCEDRPNLSTCGVCAFDWCDRCTPAPSTRCHNEENHLDEDEAEELAALKALAAEAEDYAPDWHYGATLIRDSYFEEYARDLADNIGALTAAVEWPLTCIDWEQAARELQQDYTSVEWDGVTYWVR